ncbi:MAG: LysR substrate-binding domain-containing protein [Gammaproteobacteria bacterium]|nr:LysR substrate-binding domain-containing protein [Gammaproteobacteria bacterium]
MQRHRQHKRDLPPLNAAVAFEAAARLGSFKEAGAELCVTPSAMSHQVRVLEDYLGVKLFERSARSVELTDFGVRYRLELGALLDRLEQSSTGEFDRDRRETKTRITVQTTDSFATRWLIPRLSEFEALHADVTVKVVTRDFRDGLRASEVDLGLLFIADKESDAAANNDARLLFAEEIFPVCSPGLIQGLDAIGVADLSRFTLIHDDNVGVSWRDWIATAAGAQTDTANINTKDGPRYNHAHLALKAAELGNGFTLASNVLAGDALTKGQLTAPFAKKISTGRGYYLVQSQTPQTRTRCRPFSEWVVSQSGRG